VTPAVGYNKVCELEDFADTDLRSVVRDVFDHERRRFGSDFPAGHEYRKYWEVGMAVRALRDFGALNPGAEILGVGAGIEATIFWLTRHVRRVFATDLYLTPGEWEFTAETPMLAEPERFAPFNDWNVRRLVVQHMNALDLRYEDESFDGLFSSSSIEHFGELDDVSRSVREMARVLRPAGVATLSTEFRIEGPSPGLPGTLIFSPAELFQAVVDAADWELVSPFDGHVSNATLATEVQFAEAAADVQAGRDQWSTYPHIVLRDGDYAWTSVHLALRKRP
jgi:SAM-dependent methyltransferase